MGNESIPAGAVEEVDLREALEQRYLSYALSTIMHRALPDMRDGLKPVHRRLLYAMRQLKLDPASGFKKSARVVGDVIGKFHPHGDQAVYDALVRLAQDFAVRFPLIEGQGNFGNVDGDNPAAMRYTEARLTAVAEWLLEGIDEDAVDFRPTYDGEEEEPVVLPGAFPNLLANGATGIAVGMATSVPPHNAVELCEAALHLIKHPKATIATLVGIVKGPDFPTGGVIVDEPETIAAAYATGRGGFRVRAAWSEERQARGAFQIVITEIPYQVQKARLIEKVAELLEARRLPLVADIRDESAEDVRIVVEPRNRTVDPALLMESLFKLTDLETRISLNLNVLAGGQVPVVMGLREALRAWLDHRREVLVRRSRHRLARIDHRLEVLDGYLVAFLNLDRVIEIIRGEDEPKPVLVAEFSLSEVQAEAILNMRLRSLRRLEEAAIREEHAKLTDERKALGKLLKSEKAQWKAVAADIAGVRDTLKKDPLLGPRRTAFGTADDHDDEALQTAMIEREPVTVVVSDKGWIRVLKGHVEDTSGLAFKAGDGLLAALPAQTTDKLIVASTGGRFFTLPVDRLPGGRGHGEPVKLMVDMADGEDVVSAFVHDPERRLLLVSTEGRGFLVAEGQVAATTRKGRQVMNVSGGAELCRCVAAAGDTVAILGENRRLLLFPLDQVAEMPRGKGVRLQRYRDGGVADVRVFASGTGLTWRDSGGRVHTRTMADVKDWLGTRAQAGRLPPTGFPRTNRFGTPEI